MTVYRPRWPVDEPFIVSSNVWAALLRINPLGGSPVDYVAKTLDLKLGATLSGGSFTVTFEDDEFNLKNRFTDLQHVWIGIQKGNNEGVWDGSLGRKWLLGGWTEKRYSGIDRKARKIMTIEGFDYMSVMPFLIFATPDAAKTYSNQDLAVVANDVLTLLKTYFFKAAPGLDFVGDNPGETVGVTLTKTYEKYNMVSEVLKDLSELALPKYDWYIRPYWLPPYPKEVHVYFHERMRRPSVKTIDWTNLRGGSDFVWGDSKDVVSEVWVTDGESHAVPPDKVTWTTGWADWQFVNETLVWDFLDWMTDQKSGSPSGPARRFLYSDVSHAWGIYAQGIWVNGVPLYARFPLTWDLAVDLRTTSHFTFDFRKGVIQPGDKYYIDLHSSGGFVRYDFTSLHTVGNNEWQLHAIALPRVDFNGAVLDWNGWVPFLSFDPTNLIYFQFVFDPDASHTINHLGIARVFFDRANYQKVSSVTTLLNPPRTLVIVDRDIESIQEAKNRAAYELALRENPKVFLKPIVDGDPSYLPGERITLNLTTPFLGVDRVINEVEMKLDERLDFECKLTLSEVTQRAPPIVPGTELEIRRMLNTTRNMGIGKPFIHEPW